MVNMKIFWSWQSDRTRRVCRDLVRSTLDAASVAAGDDLNLEDSERPDVDQDTQGEPGLVDISATIFSKIATAAVFVGDITAVAISDQGRRVANPNVLLELGYALKSLGPSRIILVANEAWGGAVNHLPFHLRNRRGPITYNLHRAATDEELERERARLVAALTPAIRASLATAVSQLDETSEPEGRSAIEGNRSIWFEPGSTLRFRDWFGRAVDHEVRFVGTTISYMRIIPKGWSNAPPTRADVHARQDARPEPLGRWSSGDGGLNTNGVLYVGNIKNGNVTTLTQWFADTGELWGVDGSPATFDGGRLILSNRYLIERWITFLWRGLRFFSAMDAKPLIRIEAGIVGLKTVRWPATFASEQVEALEEEVHHSLSSRDWSEEAKRSLILHLYSKVRQAFGLPVATLSQIDSLFPPRQPTQKGDS